MRGTAATLLFALAMAGGGMGETCERRVTRVAPRVTRLRPPTQPREPALAELRGGSGLSLPRELQLFIGAAGIFFSFSIFAVLQASEC